MREHLKAIFNSYSEIFFLSHHDIGLLVFALILVNPNVALAGVIAVVAAYLFANFIHMKKEFLASGFYTYNPLLVGLSISYLFKLTGMTIFFVVVAGIFTFVVTILFYNLFSYYLRLPILNLPFVIVSSLAYLASSQYSNLFVNAQYPQAVYQAELYLPLWITGLLKTLGAILFMPNVAAGLILLAMILLSSRISFLLTLAGYYTGTLINGLLSGSLQQAFTNLNGFNFILIAIALGGIFFIPPRRAFLLALIGVSISAFLQKSMEVFWSAYSIPVFTLPFNCVTLTFIYALGIVNYPLVARDIKGTPEETLDHYLTNLQRYPGSLRALALPFAGKWTVWQGFDGKWTHQGSWRYAYDFVITDDDGHTHKNGGRQLEDYHAFRKPVLSPIRGRVVKVIGALPDNPVNQVDKTNNWGNLIIIYDLRGFYVEISHFVQNSIKVKEGDWVEKGALLGLCGNSGYSPQPHIHLQVQPTEEIGAYTKPFSFVRYVAKNGAFYANHLPAENEIVEPIYTDKSLDLKMSFILDQEYRYEIFRAGRRIDELVLTVKMAPDGLFYFDSGKGRLYFGKFEGTFYFYRVEGRDKYLQKIFMALPRLPLAYRPQMEWRDHVPVGAVTSGPKQAPALLLAAFHHGLNKINCVSNCAGRDVIDTIVSSKFLNFTARARVELDEYLGFKSIEFDGLLLRRKTDEKVTTDSARFAAAIPAGANGRYDGVEA